MGTKDIIKQKRIELGLTMKELASKVGVSEATISRWESGTAQPSTDNLRCLGALYEVPIDYLVNEETERPISEDDSRQDENKQKHKRVLRIVAAFISVALIVAGVVYFAVLSGAKKTETIPIEDLQIEKR